VFELPKDDGLIIRTVEQGTDAWHRLKAGIPSASRFGEILTSTGDKSKQAEKYAKYLACGRVLGLNPSGHTSDAMIHGIETEAEARKAYEVKAGVVVEEVGLVYKDEDRNVLCSPDGLIDDDGGLEIKCPMATTHAEYLMNGVLPTKYKLQVQGSLWVTGRKYWDFMSYCKGFRSLVVRVTPDRKIFNALNRVMPEFNEMVDDMYNRIKEEG